MAITNLPPRKARSLLRRQIRRGRLVKKRNERGKPVWGKKGTRSAQHSLKTHHLATIFDTKANLGWFSCIALIWLAIPDLPGGLNCERENAKNAILWLGIGRPILWLAVLILNDADHGSFYWLMVRLSVMTQSARYRPKMHCFVRFVRRETFLSNHHELAQAIQR